VIDMPEGTIEISSRLAGQIAGCFNLNSRAACSCQDMRNELQKLYTLLGEFTRLSEEREQEYEKRYSCALETMLQVRDYLEETGDESRALAALIDSFLRDDGIEPMYTRAGQMLKPGLHTIGKSRADASEPDTILEVLVEGYTRKADKKVNVIRPAIVSVSSGMVSRGASP
jgi:molecular chaperone GrpE (heat shock protein)